MALFALAPIAALALSCLGSPAAPPASTFHLSIQDTAGHLSAASLTCEPAGGSHPKSQAACDVIRSANGDFQRLPTRRQMCSMIYAPVDVTAIGAWRGEPVAFKATYPNRCSANAESSGVFSF
jgi:Subtilisin inhibitor-like